jgi:hypothetical protein
MPLQLQQPSGLKMWLLPSELLLFDVMNDMPTQYVIDMGQGWAGSSDPRYRVSEVSFSRRGVVLRIYEKKKFSRTNHMSFGRLSFVNDTGSVAQSSHT